MVDLTIANSESNLGVVLDQILLKPKAEVKDHSLTGDDLTSVNSPVRIVAVRPTHKRSHQPQASWRRARQQICQAHNVQEDLGHLLCHTSHDASNPIHCLPLSIRALNSQSSVQCLLDTNSTIWRKTCLSEGCRQSRQTFKGSVREGKASLYAQLAWLLVLLEILNITAQSTTQRWVAQTKARSPWILSSETDDTCSLKVLTETCACFRN